MIVYAILAVWLSVSYTAHYGSRAHRSVSDHPYRIEIAARWSLKLCHITLDIVYHHTKIGLYLPLTSYIFVINLD